MENCGVNYWVCQKVIAFKIYICALIINLITTKIHIITKEKFIKVGFYSILFDNLMFLMKVA